MSDDTTAGDAGHTSTMPDGPDSTRHAANDAGDQELTEEQRAAAEAEERRQQSLTDPVAMRWRTQELDAYDADEPTNLRSRMVWAKQIAGAGLLPREYRDAPANVLMALEYGKVHGLSAMQSVLMLHVIEGKPGLNAEGMRALVQRAGHTITQEQGDWRSCTMYGKRADTGVEQRITWTLEDAAIAGLCTLDEETGRPIARSDRGKKLPWEQYPAAMLRARASTELCRLLFADVLGGLSYSTEELQDMARDEPTTVTVQEVVREQPAAPQPAPQRARRSRAKAKDEPTPAPAPEPEVSAPASTPVDKSVDKTAGPAPDTVAASVERLRADLPAPEPAGDTVVAGADQVAEVAAAGDTAVVSTEPDQAAEPEPVVDLNNGSTAAGEADDDPRPWLCPEDCGEELWSEEDQAKHLAEQHGPPAVLEATAPPDEEGRAAVWAELEQLAKDRGKSGVQQLMMRWTIANKKNATEATEGELREFLEANK